MRVEKFADLERMFGYTKAKQIWDERTPRKKQNKYGNKKTEIDGIKFDSIAESRYYETLKLMKKAGEVEDFELQPKFTLQEGFTTVGGVKMQAITYRADFKVKYKDGTTEIVDVKGCETQGYKNKRKLFLYKFECDSLRFVEIINGKRKEY